MIKQYQVLLLTLFAFVLASCATTPTRQALSKQGKQSIRSTRILVNSTQHDIVMKHNNWFYADVPDPYAPMDSGAIVQNNFGYDPRGGLITDLVIDGIHNYQASSAMSEIGPVRKALGNYDFIRDFNSQLKRRVATMPWLHVNDQQVKYNVHQTELGLLNSTKENTLLLVGTTYALNSTFTRLEVAAYVKLIQKSVNKQGYQTLYSNHFFFIDRLPKPNNNTEDNKKQWIENHSSLLRAKLRDAASILCDLIKMDIGNPGAGQYSDNTASVYIKTVSLGIKTPGTVVNKKNGYDIVMLNDKTMYAINPAGEITS